MKKIGFICESVLSIGGVQRVLAVIAIALSKQYNVTIISMNDNEESDHTLYDLDKNKVHITFFHPIPSKGIYAHLHRIGSAIYKKFLPKNKFTSNFYAHTSFPRSYRQQFIEELNRHNFDTIIAVHGGLSMKFATIRPQLNAKRVIGWMHNSYEAFFLNNPCYYPGLLNHFINQMRRLDDFIVLCHADAAHYEAEGLHPIVIYNPLTLVPGAPSTGTAKRFLSIGRMTPLHKGFDILIQAFANFAETDNEWTLEIVGEGQEEENLRMLIHKYGLEKRITISPFTSDIQRHYSQSSIYVMASRWEGFGLVLIEALCHSLPIIVSDLPVTREILNDQVALFFESENIDQLANYMKQNESILEKRPATLPYSENFSLGNIVLQWNEVL